ncbi:MAG: hypothetical protein ACXAAH_03125 [Promethearchaeota archaeon]|jgi:hypothetical protein
MGKKKKKEKKKKVEDNTKELDKTPVYSLDAALHSAKKTETTLQSLMREVSEEKGFVKKEEDTKIRPQLSHENRNEIAEAYAQEDVPIAQRKQSQKHQRKKIIPEANQKTEPSEVKKQKSKTTVPPKIQIEVSTVPTPVEDKIVEPSEDLAPTPPVEKAPVVKKDNIYLKLTVFFEDLLNGYNDRYERWENSISNILAIMRKMRKITKKNTDDLVVSIQNLYKKIQSELGLFKVKRDEVERIAEVDIESMSGELKRVLGLLELQVKEYQLKRVTDELIHELRY